MGVDLTAEQFAAYQETARRRSAIKAARIAERLTKAHQVARAGAQLLRTRFGATQVWLFGSLVHERNFGLHSDIDLAAQGIAPEEFFLAVAFLQDISTDFEIDLVDIDRCRPALRRAIETKGVVL